MIGSSITTVISFEIAGLDLDAALIVTVPAAFGVMVTLWLYVVSVFDRESIAASDTVRRIFSDRIVLPNWSRAEAEIYPVEPSVIPELPENSIDVMIGSSITTVISLITQGIDLDAA